ncbi:MAG: hypothetical protein WBA38_16880 [Gordonia sp. (in: high G+C Gram-positive bacteria)]|uniref:hypothetical protein n=1 Tax=Gordonia sp. (in: high G+C Gram-positive bacteria) TaxID=84139 RepID=UPI003C7644BC
MNLTEETAGIDVGEVVGLRGRAAVIIACAVWVIFLFLGTASGGVELPFVYLLGFALLGLGWFLLLWSPEDPMRLADALVAAVGGALASGLAVLACDLDYRAAILALGAAPALTFGLLPVRGRLGVAWLGAFLAVGLVVGAEWFREAELGSVAQLLVPGTIGVLAMSSLFAMLARPRAKQIAALRRLGERDRETEAVRQVRDARVYRLQAQVRPLLEYIASGQRLTDEQVAVCLLVEAGLRDRIRAPGLDMNELADAAWDARSRGVRVTLLDDREVQLVADESDELAKVRDAAVGVLVGARAGAEVTVRLLPERRDRFATIGIAEDGQARRIDFATVPSVSEPAADHGNRP